MIEKSFSHFRKNKMDSDSTQKFNFAGISTDISGYKKSF
jgi:hypothetical protein